MKQEEQEGDYFLQNKYGIACTPGLGMDDAQDQDSAASAVQSASAGVGSAVQSASAGVGSAVQSASAGVASARKGKSEGIILCCRVVQIQSFP